MPREDSGLGPNAQRRGKELRMLESLPKLDWPKNLFGEPMTVKQLMAQPLTQQNIHPTEKCSWEGCNRPHHQNIPMSIRSTHGNGFNVKYFCCDGCKSLHVRKHGRA